MLSWYRVVQALGLSSPQPQVGAGGWSSWQPIRRSHRSRPHVLVWNLWRQAFRNCPNLLGSDSLIGSCVRLALIELLLLGDWGGGGDLRWKLSCLSVRSTSSLGVIDHVVGSLTGSARPLSGLVNLLVESNLISTSGPLDDSDSVGRLLAWSTICWIPYLAWVIGVESGEATSAEEITQCSVVKEESAYVR